MQKWKRLAVFLPEKQPKSSTLYVGTPTLRILPKYLNKCLIQTFWFQITTNINVFYVFLLLNKEFILLGCRN